MIQEMAPGNEFYSEEEVQAILRLASQSHAQSGMSRDQLMQMASELGLSPEAVAKAESQLSQVKVEAEARAQEDQERAEYRKTVMSGVRGHLASYVFVNLGLIVTWAITSPHLNDFWPIYPLAGWGFGVVSHLVSVLNKGSFEENFQKWRRDRAVLEVGRQMLTSPVPAAERAPTENFMTHLTDTGVRDRLEAIKAYRNVTGCDLMTAKQVVDDYASRNPQAFR